MPKRGDLRRQHQRAPQVARVGHLHDEVGVAAGEHVARDVLVLAERALERVDAGRVDDVADLGADAARGPCVTATVVPG